MALNAKISLEELGFTTRSDCGTSRNRLCSVWSLLDQVGERPDNPPDSMNRLAVGMLVQMVAGGWRERGLAMRTWNAISPGDEAEVGKYIAQSQRSLCFRPTSALKPDQSMVRQQPRGTCEELFLLVPSFHFLLPRSQPSINKDTAPSSPR